MGTLTISPVDSSNVRVMPRYVDDVQPVDPSNAWTSPPFEPTIRDEKLYGRGASDDKGGFLGAVQAVEAIVRGGNGLSSLNVKILVEGEEEVLSPYLEPFLAKHRDLLAADVALSADGSQLSATEPTITLGFRGAVGVEITAHSLNRDVHSGAFGGAVQNAARALAQVVASLHHFDDASVAVDGFYDRSVKNPWVWVQ